MSCVSPGSVHDATAFVSTGICRRFALLSDWEELQLISDGFRIAADESHGAYEMLAVPWRGCRGSEVWCDGYNVCQLSARVHIVQVFGLLVWRWGVFQRHLPVPIRKRLGLIRACCQLHDNCRRWNSDSATSIVLFDMDRVEASLVAVRSYNGAGMQRGPRNDCQRSAVRLSMINRVQIPQRRRLYTAPGFDSSLVNRCMRRGKN